MKTSVENLDPTRVKITVTVPAEELKPHIEHAYEKIGSEINVPGFRKGHVPSRIIDQRVGRGAVLQEAVNDGLSGFYGQALEANTLVPLGQPEVDVTKVPDVEDAKGELVFTAEVDIRPEFELPNPGTLEITVDAVTVSAKDVEERLTDLRERFGSLRTVDKPAAKDSFLTIDLKAEIGGKEVDSVSGISYQVGRGNMLDGLDEALTGISAGETTTFETALAGGDHAGEKALVTVSATAIKERDLPELDEDFVQMASEFDTVDELKAGLREQVEKIKQNNQIVEIQNKILDHLLDVVAFPVPKGLVEDEVIHHLEQEGRLDDDAHREEVRANTEKGLRTQLILDKLAGNTAVQVTQQELIDFLIHRAGEYGMSPDEFIKQADSTGQIQYFVGELTRSKGLLTAAAMVKAKDSKGKAIDVKKFLGAEDPAVAAAAAASPSPSDLPDLDAVEGSEPKAATQKPTVKAAPSKKAAAKKAPAKK